RLYAEPTSNVYAIRLRVLELDASDAITDEITLTIAGVSRLQSDTAPGGDGLAAYDVPLDGGVSIEQGKRYGIEAVGLLTSPTMGEMSRGWRWAGADGDGEVLVQAGSGLASLDLPGLAFEALGDVDAPECLADVNGDGRLTPNDFNAWVLAFNAHDPRADQNGDGQIAPNDLNAWLLNYNAGC
ncbi:MAG: GC-type dockerin domain-anchored protein, partial [Planctomycetota bacterium]